MDVAQMSGSGFAIGLGVLYLVLLFTVAIMTFRKGHWVLGLIGIFIPILWLIGAVLPDKRRSSHRA
jgi:4-amino-4-deoxy-L-arabinose transferase-like glycosyltransferase